MSVLCVRCLSWPCRTPRVRTSFLSLSVTLVLLYRDRDSIFSSVRSAWPESASSLWDWAYCSVGRLTDESDSHVGSLTLVVCGLVVLWIGGFLLFYGRDASRAALFPLLFLGFMIPMPSVLLDPATLFLKLGSREAVAGLLTLTGTPYHREGFVFSLPRFAIEIADQCSGIRSSIALLLTSLLAGHMFLRTGWKKGLLVAAIVPLVLLKNGVRIVALTLLALHVDPAYLTGQLHHEGGAVFFLIALGLLSPLFVLLINSETTLSKETQ